MSIAKAHAGFDEERLADINMHMHMVSSLPESLSLVIDLLIYTTTAELHAVTHPVVLAFVVNPDL